MRKINRMVYVMEYIEVTGKDVNEAVINAAQKLETPSDELEYEVIDAGSAGFLGIGKRPAKIKARKKEAAAEEITKPVQKEAYVKADKETQENVNTVKTSDKEEGHVKAEVSEEQVKAVVNKFLSDVFKAMNMEVDIAVVLDKEEETVNVDLSGAEMGLLIGKRGQTLDSLQYLLRLVVNKEIGGYLKVKIDTEDYRKRRKETLESLAKNIAFKVKRSRTSVELEPMNPYERRIIHSALQNDRYVATKSEGEEPYRHVVVYLKKPAYGSTSGSYNSNRRYSKPYNKNYNRNSYDRNNNRRSAEVNNETATTSENE